MVFLKRCILIVLLISACAAQVQAKNFRVNSVFDIGDLTPGNGLCVAYIIINPPFVLPFCTLRAAIQESNTLPGFDSIELSSGTYSIEIEGREEDQALTGDYDITDSLLISGAGAEQTFIDAAGLDRVLDILEPGTTVTFSNLSLINGSLPAGITLDQKGGAGIRNQATLTVQYSRLTDNTLSGTVSGDAGGAILNQGNCTIRSSTISSNSAYEGGGIFNGEAGSLTVSTSTISHNTALSGAGLANVGTASLTNMTISGNIAAGSAQLSGGGVSNSGQLQLSQCTLAGNSAPGGGGIANFSTLTMVNTLLSGNRGGNCLAGAGIASQGYNLDSDGSCQLTGMDTDLRLVDPQLGPLADNGGSTKTHAIFYGSSARDKGKTLPFITTDQRGRQRPAGAAYDIGAFEASPPVTPGITLVLF